MESSEARRDEYFKEIKDIGPERLVYIDESGIDMSITKDRGWGKKGKPLRAKKSGKYYQRTNIIAGLNLNNPIAPMVFNGNCNTKLFESWVEQFLIKELSPGQVVIMDNAAFHKSQKTKELIESVGCKIIFLPPYSPDLNPIEKFWANMKRWIKDKIVEIGELYQALVHFFQITQSNSIYYICRRSIFYFKRRMSMAIVTFDIWEMANSISAVYSLERKRSMV